MQDILNVTSFWFRINNNDPTTAKQNLELFNVILYQNNFQKDFKFFKPIKCIAMGSPISGAVSEIHIYNILKNYQLGSGWKMEKFYITEDT
jgi:hypothetical protein